MEVGVIYALAGGVIGGWVLGLATSIRSNNKWKKERYKFETNLVKKQVALDASIRVMAQLVDRATEKMHPNESFNVESVVRTILNGNGSSGNGHK